MNPSKGQMAHDFAIAFAKSEYQRVSNYELQELTKDVDISNPFTPLEPFKELYDNAYNAYLEL